MVGDERWTEIPVKSLRVERLRVVPVSYTHLDVYKRQLQHCLISILTTEWKLQMDPGIKINNRTYMYTMLFVDDQVIVQNNECELQRSMLQ